MPIPTPFHERTSQLCTSLFYKDWAGYYAVKSYDTYVDREYYALRNSAGLIDVTPLFKYDVTGPDAAAFLSRVMVRNIRKLKVEQVYYTCWTDDDGKVIDDGTVSRLDDQHFRVTSADPSYSWFSRFARGYDVVIADCSDRIGSLSLQGPQSRNILAHLTNNEIHDLKYFWLMRTSVGDVDVVVSRTGYTGDLGFEIWVDNPNALYVYDALLEAGAPYGMLPAGLDAMDVTRIEAGYILNGVDYYNALHCAIDARKSSPFELGLGWMVRVKRPPFNGREALQREKAEGPPRMLVCLDIEWDAIERLFNAHGLPPEVHAGGWREPIPIYNDAGVQIGYANSGAWSPTLKKNLALATVPIKYSDIGTRVQFEITVEYERKVVPATVINKPAYDPERKRL